MARIYGKVKAADLRGFIIRNGGTGTGTLGDAWKRYLRTHGGSGNSFHELEKSWLKGLGYDSYGAWTAAGPTNGKNIDDSINQHIRK